MPTPTGLSLTDETTRETAREGRGGLVALVVLLSVTIAGLGYLGFQMLQRMDAVERQLAVLQARSDAAAAEARAAADRANTAATAAKAAAEGRVWAEAQTADARHEADTARQDATAAQQDAATAREAAARAQAEVRRLESALGQIAETRRTALGLVMNLGSDYLKFEFDKAELRPEDRELLSRIAGILTTSQDYMVSVNGHTDDVGTSEYNQKLSARRAQAVRDYLVKAGMSPDILSVEGHGKQLPLVKGGTDAARAKNRRVELGIVHTQIRYGK